MPLSFNGDLDKSLYDREYAVGAGKMARWLTTLALAEAMSPAHSQQLTARHNSCVMGSITLFRPPWALTHIDNKNLKMM